jgi:hypothetical protein
MEAVRLVSPRALFNNWVKRALASRASSCGRSINVVPRARRDASDIEEVRFLHCRRC